MTREELITHCEIQVKQCEKWAKYNRVEPSGKIYEEHKLILGLLLEQEELYDFAKWVAREIFDENWEYNKDANFAEIACRKLEKLGIVRAKGDEWELVESEEV
jgi:hypothetical protein